jgi:hypothetical protein
LSSKFAHAIVHARVAYTENIDRVRMIHQVGESMQRCQLGSPCGARREVGVESLADGFATIRVRFKTLPSTRARSARAAAAARDDVCRPRSVPTRDRLAR